jgi:hypothetical protein
MKKILPRITALATSAITATSDGKLAYLRNVQRLSQLFYTGPRYILSHNTTPAAWTTRHESLANGFITKYADPLCLLGTGFGANTGYIMPDIDRGSPYHPCNDPRAFERFLGTLDKIGLTTPVIIQSSHSGGIHVYYFFDRDINTFRIASLCQVTLINSKFEIKDGTLELFPNCKDFGNKSNHKPHRSPLQPNGGGLLLDRQGNPLTCGENLNHETQLAAFLQLAKASARGNNIDKILRKLDPVYEIFKSSPSKYQHTHKKHESESVREWRENLEVVMNTAWTGFHQTNELIQRFIEYGVVFLKLNNEKDLFEWAFKAITSANGYKQYCRHQHQIEPRIWDWIEPTLEKEFYVPYCAHPARSIDRDKFIAQYKHSKSSPTTKAEVYTRLRVDQTVERLEQTVEIILATIANIPSRIGDVIKLIQATARENFGKGFSNPTLYKGHLKFIWMKLIDTKKVSDIVPDTSITLLNMGYCSKTLAESAFESSALDVTELPKTNLKPIGGETSHLTLDVCSVNAPLQPSLANGADPDPDLDSDLKLKHTSLNPIDLSSALTSDLPNLNIHLRSNQIEPDPIHLQSALPNFSTSHQPDLIEPFSDPIDPALVEDLSPDPIHLQSPTTPNLIDSDANPRFDRIEPSVADLISRPLRDRDKSIASDPRPSLKKFMSLSLEEKLKLTAQDLREMRLSDLPLIEGCFVRLQDTYHVHGADRGIVTEIYDWGVCVSWSDHTSGRYETDQLICTYSPNLKN